MPLDEKSPTLSQSDYAEFDYSWAKNLKENHPDVWGTGGNIRGNEAFEYWSRYKDGDRGDGVLDWVREREAWSARHYEDGRQFEKSEESPSMSNIGGVIAQIKWGTTGTLGEKKMKAVVNEVVQKKAEKESASPVNFSAIPQSACVFSVGEFEYEDNGENSKSAPVKLKARSGKAIDHWYWGKVVHDFAGMRLSKNRISIDYVHDPKEVIGYLNNFDIKTGDLIASGALVPFKDSDRATEIIHKMKQGVPYEASINFAGDGIALEEVQEGQNINVNGFELSGPAVVVREWNLRNVAICPLGADMNTETVGMFSEGKTVTARKYVPQEKVEMKENNETAVEEIKSSEAEEKLVDGVCPTCGLAVESKSEEVPESETSGAVETVVEEAEKAGDEVKGEDEEKMSVSASGLRQQFSDLCNQFGVNIAAEVFVKGGNVEDALRLALDSAKKEVELLKASASSNGNAGGGKPTLFSAAIKPTKFNLFQKQ
jgi:hypothetical protein